MTHVEECQGDQLRPYDDADQHHWPVYILGFVHFLTPTSGQPVQHPIAANQQAQNGPAIDPLIITTSAPIIPNININLEPGFLVKVLIHQTFLAVRHHEVVGCRPRNAKAQALIVGEVEVRVQGQGQGEMGCQGVGVCGGLLAFQLQLLLPDLVGDELEGEPILAIGRQSLRVEPAPEGNHNFTRPQLHPIQVQPTFLLPQLHCLEISGHYSRIQRMDKQGDQDNQEHGHCCYVLLDFVYIFLLIIIVCLLILLIGYYVGEFWNSSVQEC